MERNANRGPQTRARILVVTVGVLISIGIGLYIHRSLTVSNIPALIDTVSRFCIRQTGQGAEEWPRIVAVRTRPAVWAFKVATGPPATETVIGYGTFNRRTLDGTFTESSEGVIPRIFQPGRSVRLSCPNKVKDSLTRQEGLERAANLRQFLSDEKEIALDVKFWPDRTPDTIPLWHALLEHGWITPDDKVMLIFLYDTNAFDGELRFHVDPSYYEDNSPSPSGISLHGSISTRTLQVDADNPGA